MTSAKPRTGHDYRVQDTTGTAGMSRFWFRPGPVRNLYGRPWCKPSQHVRAAVAVLHQSLDRPRIQDLIGHSGRTCSVKSLTGLSQGRYLGYDRNSSISMTWWPWEDTTIARGPFVVVQVDETFIWSKACRFYCLPKAVHSLARIRFDQINVHPRFPAGIIDSAEAQMKLNLNEWVCTDMNVSWTNPKYKQSTKGLYGIRIIHTTIGSIKEVWSKCLVRLAQDTFRIGSDLNELCWFRIASAYVPCLQGYELFLLLT